MARKRHIARLALGQLLAGLAVAVALTGCGRGGFDLGLRAASGLGWVERSPTNHTTITAVWSSPVIALSGQRLQLYADDVCATPAGDVVHLVSGTLTTWELLPPADGFYTFTLTSIDLAGNDRVSECSPPLLVDTGIPSLSAVTLGVVPPGTGDTPTLTFVATDPGGSGVARTEARVVDARSGAEIVRWTSVTSGGALSGLSLSSYVIYEAELRAVDGAGNPSTVAVSSAWIPDSGDCQGARLTNAPFANSGLADGLTPATAFEICTVDQLNAVNGSATNLDKQYKLKANLDMRDLSATFAMIGQGFPQGFSGTFDGEDRTIANLTLNRPTTDYVGLFSLVTSGALISRLTLSNVDVTGRYVVAAAAGNMTDDSTMMDVRVSGRVQGADSVGAVVGEQGYSSGTQVTHLIRLESSADVGGTGYATGGLVGYFYGHGLLQQSSASGTVTCNSFIDSSECGGLIGALEFSTVTDSHASGDVFCNLMGTYPGCGGFIGTFDTTSSNFYRDYATGNVTSTGDFAGGFVGEDGDGGYVEDCYATGDVSGADNVGGFIGAHWSCSHLSRNYATGVVVGTGTYVGGFVGQYGSCGSEADNFATGSVCGASAANDVGGYIGFMDASASLGAAYYASSALCTNTAGSCGTAHGTGIDLVAQPDYFFLSTNPPLSSWDFTTVWQERAGAYPTLR